MTIQAPATITPIRPLVTQPASKLSPLPAVRAAHADLIRALLAEQPDAITGCWAHPSEIADRATHIGKLLSLVTDYVAVVLADTNEYAGRVEHHYLTGMLRDATADVVGNLRFAAEQPEGV